MRLQRVWFYSRVDVPEENRKDMYLYIDECRNFITENLATMLAEMRKFRLNLTLANQHLGQFADHPQVLAAILGNTGSLIAFRTGAQDAHVLQEEFFPKIDKRDLVRLGKYQVFLKLMIEGVVSEGFGVRTLRPK